MAKTRVPAVRNPVARVLPLLGLPHLDRFFDYLVDEADSDIALPGTRVRVRFAGRLVDAVIYERQPTSEHPNELRYIERVISELVVFPQQLRKLVENLALRYGATRSDLIRNVIPPRHAGAENSDIATAWEDLGKAKEPDLSAWSQYQFGESFVDSVLSGAKARAAWQCLPAKNWADPVAALATKVALDGGGALIVVPDARAVEFLEKSLRKHVSAKQITVLTAGLGPQARYRRYLGVLNGSARIVIGTRSAAFAPLKNLRLAVVMFDGDENLVDPRAPYTHVREVLTTRSSIEGCALLIGGHTRTAETQLLVSAGWAHDLVATRDTVRAHMPRIQAIADSDIALERDPLARSARIPAIAFQALRQGLKRGVPVLVQAPRKGYIPTLACGSCRAPARCRYCNGPLGLAHSSTEEDTAASIAGAATAAVPTCNWCGRPDPRHRCTVCGSAKLRAVVLGVERTVEELGRAFPQTTVIASGGAKIISEIENHAALVVATPGAAPRVKDGHYGAAVLLDTWAQLGRQDLRATEETLATWAAVATQVEPHTAGGHVVVVADSALEVVQNFIRWDVVGAAQRELEQRKQVSLPPAVHLAAIDGPALALNNLLESAELPANAEVLGPVDLPPGVRLPGEYNDDIYGPPQRILIRTPLGPRSELGQALKAALVSRIVRKEELPLRIQIDPVRVG
ncbi:primosomal protein N' [Corynebacterium caspium]|uniref:primosomal protein N' n=1 Tax=Corynebacterium caspium TaxID=234828 RepID=UPI0003648B08|nr:primosomal protein N' [Corynebacterium caspium]WKD59222.1 Primosomal protein N' [Corynebacterium caspium DSM 44850]